MVNLNFISTSSVRLLDWSLSAFHTSLFFWLFAIVLYLTGSLGNLLASLNTIVGVIIFVFLWVTTWVCTRVVVRLVANRTAWGATQISPGWRLILAMILALLGGSVNGLAFFLILLFVAAIVASGAVVASRSLTDIPALVVIFGYAIGIGSFLAIGIGGIFGLIFGILDLLLLAGSNVLFALNGRGTGPNA